MQLEEIVQPLATNAAGIAASQAPTGATPLALTSSPVALPQVTRPTLASAGNLSAVNFTVTGTDRLGSAISETIAGPNANTVSTTKWFATVIAVTPSATNATTLTVGWGTEVASRWLVLGSKRGHYTYLTRVFADAAASGISYDVELTSEADLWRNVSGEQPDDVYAAATAQNAGYVSTNDTPWTAVRIHVHTLAGGNLHLRVIPSRSG